MDGARDWGVLDQLSDGEEKSRPDIWRDDVRSVKTTNWPPHLIERKLLLASYANGWHPHDQVFFANPLCVGFSEKHARSVLEVIHGTGALVYIHDMGQEFRPGDDLGPFWVEHKRQLKNAQMKKHRTG